MAYNFNLPFKSTRNVGCAEIKSFIHGAQCPLEHGSYVAIVYNELLPWSEVPMTSVSIATKYFSGSYSKLSSNTHPIIKYLRNRKHVPCFYRVIQTRVEVWENENAVGTRAAGDCFHSFFEFSQTCTSVCITR